MSAKRPGQRNSRPLPTAERCIAPDIPGKRNSRQPTGGDSYVVRAIDRKIARLAARQRGVVTREQLLALGLRPSAIDERIAAGKLHPLHRGVYLVGHAVPPLGAQEMAAVLACGRGAVLSHYSAGEQFEVLEKNDGPIHVSIPGGSRRQRDGIRLHKPTTLTAGDTGDWDGIPITSPARTLFDLAATVPFRVLEHAVNEAQIKRLVTARELTDRLDTHRGRGTSALKAILNTRPTKSRSPGESLLRTLIRKANLPPAEMNAKVHGYEWDFHWADAKLLVEADSVGYHSLPAKVEHDRRKDAHARARGYEVLRFTYTQIAYEPEVVIAGIAAALATRRRYTDSSTTPVIAASTPAH
jgi:very-short-patch-repair endonuclease